MFKKISVHYHQVFNVKPRKLIGVEFVNQTIKLLQMHYKNNNYVVEAYGLETIQNKNDLLDEKVKVIKKMLAQTNGLAKFAIVAIENSTVIRKIIQVDARLSDNEIEQQVIFEVEKQLSVSLQDAYLDFQALETLKDPSWREVEVVITRNENVRFYQKIIESVGLVLKIVDVEAYVLQRIAKFITSNLPNQYEAKVIALANINQDKISITILNRFSVVFTKEEIISYDSEKEILQTIQRFFQLYSDLEGFQQINLLLLLGDVTSTLATYLQEKLLIPSKII